MRESPNEGSTLFARISKNQPVKIMLSKIMSTAALIAASTALASAATVVFTTASSVSGATEIVKLNKTGTSYDGYTVDSNNKEVSPTYPMTYSYTAKTSFGDSALSFKYAISAGKIWTDAVSNSTNTNTALNTAFTEATGLSLSDYAGSRFYGSGSGSSYATLTFSGLKANTEYRFSFVGAARGTDSSSGDNGSTELSITTGTLSSTTRGGGSFYGVMSGTTTTSLTADSATALLTNADVSTTKDTTNTFPSSSALSAATFVVMSDESGTVVFKAGPDKNKPGFVAIAVSDVIPEPSAFGLLAGIGALALAVSRRKRRA